MIKLDHRLTTGRFKILKSLFKGIFIEEKIEIINNNSLKVFSRGTIISQMIILIILPFIWVSYLFKGGFEYANKEVKGWLVLKFTFHGYSYRRKNKLFFELLEQNGHLPLEVEE